MFQKRKKADSTQVCYEITCPFCFQKCLPNDVHFRVEPLHYAAAGGQLGKIGDFMIPIFSEQTQVDLDANVSPAQEAMRPSMPGKQDMSVPLTKETCEMQFEDDILEAYYARHQINAPSLLPPVIAPESASWDSYDYSPDACHIPIAYRQPNGERTERRLCPKCHMPLPTRAGRCEQRFIAVSGNTQAGKTVFLVSLMNNPQIIRCKGTEWSADNEFNKLTHIGMVRYGDLSEQLEHGILPTPTNVSDKDKLPPVVFSFKNRLLQKEYMICFYDMPGEMLDSNHIQDLRRHSEFIRYANGIMYLIDATSLLDEGNTIDLEHPEDEPERVEDKQERQTASRNAHSVRRIVDALSSVQSIVADGTIGQVPIALTITKGDRLIASEGLLELSDRLKLGQKQHEGDRTCTPSAHINGYDQNETRRVEEICLGILDRMDLVQTWSMIAECVRNSRSNDQQRTRLFFICALGSPVELVARSVRDHYYNGRFQFREPVITRIANENYLPIRMEDPIVWLLRRMDIFPRKDQTRTDSKDSR